MEIVTLKSKSFASPSQIITSANKTLVNPTDIANEFNNYFANLGKNVILSIPKVNASFYDFLSAPIHHSFLLTHIETREIEEIISGLKLGKACGPYSIPVSVLKTLNIVILKPLQILYNLSFLIARFCSRNTNFQIWFTFFCSQFQTRFPIINF